MNGVRPPRNNTHRSLLTLVARSRANGFDPIISRCFHIAQLAEEFLSPRRSRLQNHLPFEFSHTPPHMDRSWLAALKFLERFSLLQRGFPSASMAFHDSPNCNPLLTH